MFQPKRPLLRKLGGLLISPLLCEESGVGGRRQAWGATFHHIAVELCQGADQQGDRGAIHEERVDLQQAMEMVVRKLEQSGMEQGLALQGHGLCPM